MTNWRNIPHLSCEIDQTTKENVTSSCTRIILCLNLALLKTFNNQKYKKFAILFTTYDGKYLFDIVCHEVEFMANFEKFVDGTYSSEDSLPFLQNITTKFSNIISKFPVGKFMAATIVYDEQYGTIELGGESLQMDITTTSSLLFHLSSMFHSSIFGDPDGLIFEYYNLEKLMCYNMDTGKIDFTKIKINVDNYEDWDYYYPEYDREVEESKRRYKKQIENESVVRPNGPKQIKLPTNDDEFFEIINNIIIDFKNMVENKGYRLLLDANKKPMHEEYCQILFEVYLKNHCKDLGIDLTREVETGRGSIDFRFAAGPYFIVHVELKKDNNPKLTHGLSNQLPTYMNSETVRMGFFLVFEFGTKDISKAKDELEKERIKLEIERGIKLRIIYIDAKSKPSASYT